jgi:ATP-dependent Clp protease adaptor protein ClpS
MAWTNQCSVQANRVQSLCGALKGWRTCSKVRRYNRRMPVLIVCPPLNLSPGQAPTPPQSCGQTTILHIRAASTKPPVPPQKPNRTRPIEPDDDGVAVLERVPQKVGPPQMYQVLMLNDDYTPMEFVVVVLQEFFQKDREQATQIMLKIHLDGKGVCGVYSKDVASTKVNLVLDAAKQAGHPLQCVSEPIT